jgi:hypothetical protein
MGATAGVQLKHLGQIHPGPHDRADELDAVQHGLKDRQPHLVVGGQTDQHQPTPGRSDRNACSKAAGAAASTIAASAPPNRWRVAAGSFGTGVDGIVGSELPGQPQLVLDQIDRGHRDPAILAYCRVRWPSPPMPSTATRSDGRVKNGDAPMIIAEAHRAGRPFHSPRALGQ